MSKKFYRYDGYEFLKADEYEVISETPSGYWIRQEWGDPKSRWIAKGNARSSFAKPSKEEALKSYKIRKRYQIQHLERQLANAKQGLEMAERGEVEDKAVWADKIEDDPIW